MRCLALLLALLCAAPAPLAAETDPAHVARRAAGQIEAAAQALEAARSARDRVRALTRVIQAYEEGLNALRSGLRLAARQEQALRLKFDAQREDISRMTGVLASIGQAQAPLLMLHPSGALDTARSGIMLADVTPALQARADELKSEINEIALLNALQIEARDSLADALDGARQARLDLSLAVADRTDLPKRIAADPERMDALRASAVSLSEFAAGLRHLAAGGDPGMDIASIQGELALPVDGNVLRQFNEPDPAGVARPGLLIATQPGALVTAPSAATLRYVGPFLDYGNVIILEPSAEILMVFAGLGTVYGDTGDIIQAGAPIGLMPGEIPQAGEFLAALDQGSGRVRDQTLYIEVRDGESAVDPAIWFALTTE